jgi:hypothetical protein
MADRSASPTGSRAGPRRWCSGCGAWHKRLGPSQLSARTWVAASTAHKVLNADRGDLGLDCPKDLSCSHCGRCGQLFSLLPTNREGQLLSRSAEQLCGDPVEVADPRRDVISALRPMRLGGGS